MKKNHLDLSIDSLERIENPMTAEEIGDKQVRDAMIAAAIMIGIAIALT